MWYVAKVKSQVCICSSSLLVPNKRQVIAKHITLVQ